MPFTPLGKDEWQAMLGMVPQSHTCTNTLELPDYLGECRSALPISRQPL